MLQKENRLRKQKEYDRVFEKNRRIKSVHFQLLIHFRKNQLMPKVGIIVSSKVGKAVIRNKIKRRIRDIVRSNLNKFPINGEYVFIAYPQIVDLEFSALQKEIEKAINSIKDIPQI